ncbi:MAG: chromosomal replication initiator protein DnaA [Actinomycetaceae bacterium]|nr:chromosomal replication initiator protein DnaA [Actinomycetaceae bacterium]
MVENTDEIPLETLAMAWTSSIAKVETENVLSAAQLPFLRQSRPLGLLDGSILLAVPNDVARQVIMEVAYKTLTNSLSSSLGRPLRIVATIDAALADVPLPPTTGEFPVLTIPKETPETPPSQETPISILLRDPETHLNPKYTFETFVVGQSNRFASAAATAIVEAPAKAYNPLFVYGGSGLGKTHLLHAIGNYALSLYPQMRVRYLNSEEFTNDFINSIRDDRAEEFQRRYREVDFLLVDDIQFIQDKEQTIEEFFHTFNALHNANKQVVITSDLPPKQLHGFEERMVSRFEWGLLVDVQPPDLETRIAILSKKAASQDLDAPYDVLEYIASRISSNIRELEGALLRVTAFASLNRQPLEKSLAELVLKDLISNTETHEVTVSLIMAQTAEYFSITIDDLCSSDRSRGLVEPRQIAMYLCRELTESSLPKIGQSFGGRDHSTVMHANKKISSQMAEKRTIFNHVTELTNRIKNATSRS